MTRANTVVANLLNALDAIARAAAKPHQQPYIQGIAEQAIRMAHADMVRNSDGYLVVREQASEQRCEGRYPVPLERAEPFPVTYRCALKCGHEGQHSS